MRARHHLVLDLYIGDIAVGWGGPADFDLALCDTVGSYGRSGAVARKRAACRADDAGHVTTSAGSAVALRGQFFHARVPRVNRRIGLLHVDLGAERDRAASLGSQGKAPCQDLQEFLSPVEERKRHGYHVENRHLNTVKIELERPGSLLAASHQFELRQPLGRRHADREGELDIEVPALAVIGGEIGIAIGVERRSGIIAVNRILHVGREVRDLPVSQRRDVSALDRVEEVMHRNLRLPPERIGGDLHRPDRGGHGTRGYVRRVYRKIFVLQHAHVRVLCSQAAKGREHVGADWIRPRSRFGKRYGVNLRSAACLVLGHRDDDVREVFSAVTLIGDRYGI